MPKNKGKLKKGSVVDNVDSGEPTLKELNITKDESADSQFLADLFINNPDKVEQIKKGKSTVRKERIIKKRKTDIEIIKQKITTENLTITDKFDIIAIDPPWPYGREYDPETSRVANPYPEMSIEEISKIDLPIKDDAVVFLWTTHAFLKDAFNILDKWHLTYKATMVWDKEQMGMGATIRMQCEFCLLAIKGKPIIQGADTRDIIREKRREHSRKPNIFYELVDKITIGSKLDYFSREERKGWNTFGAETNKF